MSTRSILTAALAIAGLAACKTSYSDVYSFKKNNFTPPVTKRAEIKAPESAMPGTQAPPTDPSALPPGVPGLPAPAPTGIPGLDGAPPAPAPGADPAAPPPAPAPAPAP